MQIIHQCKTSIEQLNIMLLQWKSDILTAQLQDCVGEVEWQLVLAINGFPDPGETTA